MKLLDLVKSNEELLIKHRRNLHSNPELSGQESETIAYILEELKRLNIQHHHVLNGGVLGFVKGHKPGKRILLRADIDALPIKETITQRNEAYCSKNEGVMHACGHDAHTAMLLVAAKLLSEHPELFEGEIVFCFEQGEESTFNIRYLLEYFEKQQLKFDCCFGMHISPYLDHGKLMIQAGEVMAGIGKFHITLHGQGGHGSRPDLCHNPIDGFTNIYNELNKARLIMMDPFKPFAMSVGHVQAGNASNVIADSLHFRGTYRFYDINQGLAYRTILKNIVDTQANQYNLKVTYDTLPYPSYPLINHPEVVELCKEALGMFSDDFVESTPWMGSESFPYYQLQTPGAFIFLGIRNEAKNITADIHNPAFELDEDVLYRGVYAHMQMALTFLNQAHKFKHTKHNETVAEVFSKLGYLL